MRSFETLRLERPRAGVALVTLDRPHRLNAITFAMVDELHTALEQIDADNACKVVVLTGAGRGFCSGLDLKEISGSSKSYGLSGAAAALRSQQHIADLVPHFARLQQPVISAVNGPAYGGGFAFACAADVRIASTSANFCTQFINVGIAGCDVGVSYTLPRLIGAARAHELILTGRSFDAVEAGRIGFVSQVVPDEQLLDAALSVASMIAERDRFALTLTKEVMRLNVDAPSLDAALAVENRNQALSGTRLDAH